MNTPLALVVEDDQDLGVIFTQALRSAGFEVATAGTAAEAIAWLKQHTPHVVTLDLHLPQARGDEVIRYLRAEPRLADANIILTTADAALAEGLHEQADYVLIKPISFTQLRDLSQRLKVMH